MKEPSINAYYLGERKINGTFPTLNEEAIYRHTSDIAFKMLTNGSLDFIDYKEKSKNNATNGKYFRIYLDKDGAKECYLSTDIAIRNFSKNSSLTNLEINMFFNELHSNQKDEKQILKEIELLLQDRNTSIEKKNLSKLAVEFIKDDIKNLKQIYKDKCIARKEISEDEIAPIELIVEDPYVGLIEPKPNIKTIFDNLLGMGFNYGGIIKDRMTGKILAGNIYIYEYYNSFLFLLQAVIKALGSQSEGSFRLCDRGSSNSIIECNTKLITEFFRKDKR